MAGKGVSVRTGKARRRGSALGAQHAPGLAPVNRVMKRKLAARPAGSAALKTSPGGVFVGTPTFGSIKSQLPQRRLVVLNNMAGEAARSGLAPDRVAEVSRIMGHPPLEAQYLMMQHAHLIKRSGQGAQQ